MELYDVVKENGIYRTVPADSTRHNSKIQVVEKYLSEEEADILAEDLNGVYSEAL